MLIFRSKNEISDSWTYRNRSQTINISMRNEIKVYFSAQIFNSLPTGIRDNYE